MHLQRLCMRPTQSLRWQQWSREVWWVFRRRFVQVFRTRRKHRKFLFLLKSTGGSKQNNCMSHYMTVFLINRLTTEGARNILPELPNGAEYDVACFWRWLPETLVSPPTPRPGSSPIVHPMYVVYTWILPLVGDPREKAW